MGGYWKPWFRPFDDVAKRGLWLALLLVRPSWTWTAIVWPLHPPFAPLLGMWSWLVVLLTVLLLASPSLTLFAFSTSLWVGNLILSPVLSRAIGL